MGCGKNTAPLSSLNILSHFCQQFLKNKEDKWWKKIDFLPIMDETLLL